MKNLIIMRHAEAGYGSVDHERALTAFGVSQAQCMGRMLAERFAVIDYAWVSDARRTRQTLRGLTSGGLSVEHTSLSADLYHGNYLDLARCVSDTPAQCSTVLILAHEPSVSSLVGYYADTSTEPARQLMRGFSPATVGIAKVEVAWNDLGMGMLPTWEKLNAQ